MGSPVRPIQAFAYGYQGLLGLKNMGNLPVEQPDSVQPVIEMSGFYLQGRRRAVSVGNSAVNGTSLGTVALATAVQVPPNKTWYILGGCLNLSIAAAQVLSISARLIATTSLAPSSSVIVLSEPVSVGAANAAAAAIAGSGVYLTVPVRPDIILQASDSVYFTVDWASGAGAGNLTMNLIYAEVDQ